MDRQIDTYYEDNLDHEKFCFVCGTEFEDADPNRMLCSNECHKRFHKWGVCAKDWPIWKDIMKIAHGFKDDECRHVVYLLMLIGVKNRKKKLAEGKLDE